MLHARQFILFALVTFANFSVTQVFADGAKNTSYSAAYQPLYIEYLRDTTTKLTLADIDALQPTAWTRSNTALLNFETSKDAIWLKVHLPVNPNNATKWVVDIHYPYLDIVEFYTMSASGPVSQYKTGDTRPFDTRPINFSTFAFPVEANKGEQTFAYVKVESEGSLEIPIYAYQFDEFYKQQLPGIIVYIAVFAVLLVMGAYNLFVFFATKETIYVYYTGYCAAVLGYFAATSGVGYQFLWTDHIDMQRAAGLLFNGITIALLGLFTNSFLKLENHSWCQRWILTLSVFATISAVGPEIFNYTTAYKFGVLIVVLMNLSALMIGIYVWIKGFSQARLFVITWSAHFTTSAYTALAKTGVIATTPYTEFVVPLSSVIVVVLLSFAMADRISLNQNAIVAAQNAALKNLNRFKTLFDTAIEGIFVIDLKGNWQSVNPAALAMFGHSDIDELRQDFAQLDQQSFRHQAFKTALTTIINNGSVSNHTVLLSKKNGAEFWSSVNARVVRSENGTPVVEGTFIDVSARIAFENKLNFLARHDPLTSLLNRRAFEDYLLEAIKTGQADRTPYALLYLDLDQFKVLNDSCGHSAGDNLLIQLSSRLKSRLKSNHILARLGGDEFGMLITNSSPAEALVDAKAIQETIQSFRFRHSEREFAVGVSIGIVCFQDEYMSLESLLGRADAACFMAKDLGRNRVHLFEESDQQIQQRQSEMAWVGVIKEAIKKDLFCLMYQHIEANKRIVNGHHYELLLRLKHENNKSLYTPANFMGAAERYGLMPQIDEWVITTYFEWLQQHPEHMENLDKASINVSGHSLGDEGFMNFLEQAFVKYDVPPNKICFEITETMAITRMDKTLEFIFKYKEKGCLFALDDFGTGFSSYAYLKELPVDYLKIDGFFVRNIASDPVDKAMVQSIQQVASMMKIKTIAEFVENEETLEVLQDLGIHYSQGYLVHKPELLVRFNAVVTSADSQ